jgi:hypothetical protein
MASIISAGTTSGTALNFLGDTSGNLQLTTQAGANVISVPNVTGTLLVPTSVGTAGQLLQSNGASPPTFVAASGLGIGQTWQDVTGSRALGTTYTNSTSSPIAVSVNTSTGAQTTLTVGGVVAGRYSQSTGGLGSQLSAVVPVGVSYVATGGTLSNWAELR